MNTYGYALQNPLVFTDPTGQAAGRSCELTGTCPSGSGTTGLRIDEECCEQVDDLKNQIVTACAVAAAKVKNPKLRSCILEKCQNVRVSCDGLVCWTLGAIAWSNPFYEANLCIKGNTGVGGGNHWGCILVHELAHACGWGNFYDQHPPGGEGVPGGDGSHYNYNQCEAFTELPPTP